MTPDFYLISASLKAHRLRPERAYVFGREEGVDIVLTDALASRRHAELRWCPEGCWEIIDLRSRNGVFVNSSRIPGPVRLADGDQIQAGGQVFSFHMLPPGGDPQSLGNLAPHIAMIETRSHQSRVHETAMGGAAFSGEVTEGGVPELLQFFNAGSKTGRLDLIDGPDAASVWIIDGDPIHATYGTAVGLDALISLAKAPPPRFTFYAGASVPVERSLEGTMNGILMKVAQHLHKQA
jgi:hypothetical protein